MLHYNVETQLRLVFEDIPYPSGRLQFDGKVERVALVRKGDQQGCLQALGIPGS